MKPLAAALLALLCAAPLPAQRYLLRDGRILDHADTAVKDGRLVRVLSGSAELTYPLSQVVRLDWPAPPELQAAAALLAAGKAPEAETALLPVLRRFAPFPSVPGSWWSTAALLRTRSLLAQKNFPDTENAAREIIAAQASPDDVQAAVLLLAEVRLRLGQAASADAMLDELLRPRASPEIAARALLLRGDIASAQNQPEKALGYYLQIPVFHGTRDDLMPAALLGSARAYQAYGDPVRAERATLDLLAAYPASAEAAAAKAEARL